MVSSDDEVEVKPQSVSNYFFEGEGEEKISFSVLPIQWNENERTAGERELLYLRGSADAGLLKVHIPVIAWKFDLTNPTPEMFVLSKDKTWIKLQKPRKSFEEIIRTILITVHCLSYARRDPEATGRSIWDSLSRVFCSYEVRPSRNDLVDHMDLIREALKHDIVLANSKFLVAFLEGKLTKRELSDEVVQGATMSRFIVDDMEDDLVDDVDEDDSNEEEELFDSVCSFCDNGGELLCCEGRCMRSFHANVVAGEESQCVSLGFTEDEVEAMQNFFCKNCEHKQHQCFACGKLGSSNKETGAEVFPCASATCGHFYHPHCVSELLYRNSEVAADQLQKTISAGESFICPLHKCFKCKQGENRADKDLQFAVCRRCPRSYHRRCLPREIAFEENAKEGIVSRAWEGLLPNDRILIYCLNHKIDDELGTPIRDHIIFPGDEQKKTVIGRLGKRKALAAPTEESSLTSKVSSQGKFDVRALKRMSSSAGHGETTKKCERLLTRPDLSRKTKATDISRKSLMEKLKSDTGQVVKSSSADTKKSTLGDMLYERFVVPGTEQKKLGKLADTANDENKTIIAKPKKMLIDELPSLDLDSEKRLLSLMKKAASSVTMEDALKKHKIPSTHANSAKYVVDKTITLGKVEGSVEAVRTALKKLEVDGSSIEDAKAVCEPQVLNQIFKWKNKLKVYLAPFLHGMRYTSFGRHFTKVDKLQEIVDKLHYYVNDGDMIVDFCCGANDFSCLMKKKLDETGKKCFYKNYDILQAKNDFCFEKRDWMTVQKRELAPGSRLIMGLNPPFGVKAALANKFINKALQFGPKLLILIVPPETERLDRKKPPYELVWEDNQFLSGKSFYLPGSVDEHDKQMDQWNLTAPPLYLWSRCDMAAEHKALAEKHGHVFVKIKETQVERDSSKTYAADHSREEDQGDTSVLDDFPLQSNEMKELQEAGVDDINGSSEGATEGEDLSNLTHGGKTTRKRKHGKKKVRRVISEISPLGAQNGGRHLASETCNRFPQHSTDTVLNVKSSLEGHSSKSLETPSRVESYQCNKMPHSPAAKPIDTDEMSHISTGTAINAGYSLQDLPLKSIEMPSYTRFDDNVHQHFDDKEVPQCSPNNLTAKCPLENRFSRSVELPSETGFGSAYHHVEPTISSSHMQMGTTYNGTPACMPDDMGSYGVSNSEPARGVNYGFLHGGNSDERFAGHVRNDSFGHRVFMSRDMGSDMRPHTRMYGQDFPEPPSRYGQMGSMSYDVHGNLGPSAEASYRMSTSTMERYAPRLDQMHNQRMSPFRPEPFMQNRTGFYEPRAPQPGFPPEVDFAPGFPHPFPHQGSGGWVDG